MPRRAPKAKIRTQVTVPLRFADGYQATTRVFTFDGLVDRREHLALGQARPQPPSRWSGRTVSA